MLSDENRVQSKSFERLFEIVVARAHETIVVTDGALDDEGGPAILFVNEAAAKRIGKSVAALTGAPFRKIVLPDNWAGVIARLRQVRDSRQADQMELRAKDHTGKEYWLELSTLPIFDAAGALEYIVRIGRDISARKVAEQQREMTQDLMASLFGAIDVPLIVAGESGNVMMTNVALQDALGWSLLDVTGRPLASVLAEEERPKLAAGLRAAEDSQQAMHDVTLLQRSGDTVKGSLQITKVRSPNRQNYYLVKFELGANAEEALRRRADRPVVAGKLQLVGFSQLKEELGARWPELHERVFDIADQVIRRHLQPRDLCQRSGSDGFLVFFEHLEEADAQAKAALIGEEVRRHLMGELPEGSELLVAAFAARVSITAGENATEQGLLDAFNRRLEVERQKQEVSAIQAARRLFESAKPVFQDVETVDGQPGPIVLTRLPDRLRETIATLASLGQASYSVEADAFCLAGAGAHVIANLSRGSMPLILVPVRFDNLARRRDFEAVLKTARSIGDAGRAQIAVEIVNVPRAIIRTRLADTALRFASLVRSVAFELPTADHAFVTGLPISTRLATISSDLLRDGAAISVPTAARLVELLKLRQCRLIVKDVDPGPDLAALGEAGVRLVSRAA